MKEPIRILVVDDEAPIRAVLADSLRDEDYEVELASDGESALKALEVFKPQVTFMDVWMPGPRDGLQVIQEARQRNITSDFIVMSGHGTIETAVRATKLGAWDFIEKPISMDRIFILLKNILSFQSARDEKDALLMRFRRNIAMVGDGTQMMDFKSWIASMSAQPVPAIVLGESGTGKGLTAENIHYLSGKASQPFIRLNCGLIPEELIEAELFGAAQAPGAPSPRRGKLDLVEEGTLYLEKFQALPFTIQEKLSLYLADSKRPFAGKIVLGCTKAPNDPSVSLSPRWLSDLPQYSFEIAPLRARVSDIPALVRHFSDMFVQAGAYRQKHFKDDALEHMMAYQWPGNVRELRNFIERLFILIPGEQVGIEDLELAGLRLEKDEEDSFAPFKEANFKAARGQFEREFILRKLEENRGNISKTAEIIGVERSHLHRKIKAYGIEN